jgi:PAS domain S-box-containing protein
MYITAWPNGELKNFKVYFFVNSSDSDSIYTGSTFQSFFQASPRSLVMKADAPRFTILAVSDVYLNLVHKQRYELLGKGLFEVFPGSAGDPSEQNSVHSSFLRVIQTAKPDELPIFKYEIVTDDAAGKKETHYWTNLNEPLLDENGEVIYLINTATNITEQIRQQQVVEESESRFRLMAENTDVMIAVGDESGAAVYFNQAWANMTGRSIEELMAYGWVDLMHPDDKESVLKIFQTAFQRQEYWTWEFRMPDRMSGYRWLLAKGTPRFHSDGTFAGYISTTVDITEQKDQQIHLEKLNQELVLANQKMLAVNEDIREANEELQRTQLSLEQTADKLQQSEAWFRSLLEQSPVAFAFYRGPEFVVEVFNEKVLEFWGRTADQVAGLPLFKALPETARQGFEELLTNVYETGARFVANELPVTLLRNGELEDTWINFVYEAVRGKQGNIEGIIVVCIEVTEQVNARKKLEESESRLQGILDTMAEGVGITDDKGKLVYANPMAQRLLGLTESAIKERTFDDPQWQNLNVDGSPLPEGEHPMAIMMQTKTPVYDHEIAVQPAEGERFYISINAAPILNNEGQLTGGVGTFMDVTERRKLAMQKDDFISVASHELKTPITSLTASLQLLDRMKDNPNPGAMTKFIEQANKSLSKLNSLIKDLLDSNRISQGQLQLRKTKFTIAEMINDCCQHVRASGKHEIVLKGDLQLKICADEQQIDQVVINLVNNAVKYAPNSRSIYINIEKLAGDARISVSDEGPGIAADKIPHLFDRYYRADYSGIQFSGLGLGLYICAEIVRKHGGIIGVESELGRGSTFWFKLPLN